MKKTFLLALCFIFATFGYTQPGDGISIIPQPADIKKGDGFFQLTGSPVVVVTSADPDLKRVANQLATALSTPTGYSVTVGSSGPGPIELALNKNADKTLGDEGYRLTVTTSAINITANKPAGVFYGMQTLLQLFPKEIVSKSKMTADWRVPVVTITDVPRFSWRGLMFDVSRHFFTKQQVMEYIDAMVRYKFNLLHLTLANDEGWRIQIKSLPRLTEVGAWNVKKVGYFGSFPAPGADEPRNYGGFYTQDDIRELVQYAKDRFVNILPEIDVPGHSLAAVVSYPELSCTPGADKYRVRSGEEIMDWSHGAPPIALADNTLCPANEKVYTFLDKVLTEVTPLFPFEYMHMGGDECPKNFWEKSDAIKALMKKEGLKNMEEVQSYFEKRVEKLVTSKGKKLIGWDEILEGGLAPSAAVMSWRGIKGGIEAAKMGHEVVMTPANFVYLDYMQADVITEPRVYSTLRLSKAYEFEPVPDGVDPKYIKGGQGNLWTEQVYNMRHAEYMTWPRGLALAECLWSPKEKKNWDDFFSRVEQQFPRLDIAQVKYARAAYDPIFEVAKNDKGDIVVTLKTEVKALDIYYSFDNSFPDNFYPKYEQPLVFPPEAAALKLITYRDGKPVGRMITMPIDELKRRTAKK